MNPKMSQKLEPWVQIDSQDGWVRSWCIDGGFVKFCLALLI